MKKQSTVHLIAAPVDRVYARLADLTSLQPLAQAAANPDSDFARRAQAADQQHAEQALQALASATITPDTLTIPLPMIGQLTLAIIEREPGKLVKLQAQQSPIPATLWLQTLPAADDTTRLRLTADIDLPLFLRAMAGNKVETAVEQLATLLAALPY